MGFPNLNPFKRDRQNFPGVVIPLAAAPAHAPVDPSDEKKGFPNDKPEDAAERGSAHGSTSGSQHEAAYLTLEGLRAEIEADVAASGGHDSAYDRMCLAPVPISSDLPQAPFPTLPSWRCLCLECELI